LIFFLLTRWTARKNLERTHPACGTQASLPADSCVRCAGIACDRFAQLLMEVAGRMCRQLICGAGLRLQTATRLKSIKQIEIYCVIWKYHLPTQMATNLIQMGTP